MISKIVKKESSGIFFGVFFLFGAIGVLLINLLGGYLYDKVSHMAPFIVGLIAYCLHTLIILIAAICKKSNK